MTRMKDAPPPFFYRLLGTELILAKIRVPVKVLLPSLTKSVSVCYAIDGALELSISSSARIAIPQLWRQSPSSAKSMRYAPEEGGARSPPRHSDKPWELRDPLRAFRLGKLTTLGKFPSCIGPLLSLWDF
jgi:hypothetical protein